MRKVTISHLGCTDLGFDNQLIDNNKNSYNSSWSSNIETDLYIDDEIELPFSDYDGLSSKYGDSYEVNEDDLESGEHIDNWRPF